jgi:hypothetical protein
VNVSTATAALLLGSLAILPLYAENVKAMIRDRTVDRTSKFVLLVGLAGSLPFALGRLSGASQNYSGPLGIAIETFSPWVARLQTFTIGLALLVGALFVLRQVKGRRVLVNPAGLIALALWILAAVANAAHNLPPVAPVALATGPVFLIAALLPRSRSLPVAVSTLLLTFGLLSTMTGLIDPQRAWLPCREAKCGPAGLLYGGSFGHENGLGLFMALGIPFLMLAARDLRHYLGVAYALLFIYISGSRTALLTAIVAVLLGLTLTVAGTTARGHLRRTALRLASLALVLLAAFPLWNVFRDDAYSLRGAGWNLAKRLGAETPFLGQGGSMWEWLERNTNVVSEVAKYSVHNQWLEIWFVSGSLGVLLFIGFLWTLMVTRASPDRLPLVHVLGTVFAAGLLERPWSFYDFNWLTWTLIASIVLLSPSSSWSHRIMPVNMECDDGSENSPVQGYVAGRIARTQDTKVSVENRGNGEAHR